MQDEVNEKVIALCINGGKISARILKNAIAKYLAKMEQGQKQVQQKSKTQKTKKEAAVYQGKQSLEKLKAQKCELSNIEITDNNIKSFEKFARKYEIDYSLKKDTSRTPPRYYVFFKVKDEAVMTAAFKEYTGWQMKKDKKVSIRKKLSLAKERVVKHRERAKSKDKERGPQL